MKQLILLLEHLDSPIHLGVAANAMRGCEDQRIRQKYDFANFAFGVHNIPPRAWRSPWWCAEWRSGSDATFHWSWKNQMSWLIYCEIMSVEVCALKQERTWNSNSHLMKSHESRERIPTSQHAQCTHSFGLCHGNKIMHGIVGMFKGIFNYPEPEHKTFDSIHN